jgi:hypothetical protein
LGNQPNTRGHAIAPVRDREAPGSSPGPPTKLVAHRPPRIERGMEPTGGLEPPAFSLPSKCCTRSGRAKFRHSIYLAARAPVRALPTRCGTGRFAAQGAPGRCLGQPTRIGCPPRAARPASGTFTLLPVAVRRLCSPTQNKASLIGSRPESMGATPHRSAGAGVVKSTGLTTSIEL